MVFVGVISVFMYLNTLKMSMWWLQHVAAYVYNIIKVINCVDDN